MLVFGVLRVGVHNFFFKILGARRVTRSKFHTKDQQILGATAQNSFAPDDLAPKICAPLPYRLYTYTRMCRAIYLFIYSINSVIKSSSDNLKWWLGTVGNEAGTFKVQ